MGKDILREKIEKIFKTDPNYADFINLTGIQGMYDLSSRLLDLIEQDKKNELQNFLTKWEDTNSEVAYRYIQDRISQLQSKKGNL